MDSQQPISQAVNAYDDNSFIRVDASRREQPADNTCRPIHDPILDRGYNFEAMVVPTRPFEITALPSELLLLFQQFVPISLVESWVCYTNSWVNDMSFYGRTFSRVHAWSDHIQHISTVFHIPGTSIAVDECMVRFLGRSLETTTIPSKPIPTGFKVWTVAQRGYFLRWIWHRPGRKFGPVGVRPTYRRLHSQLRMMRQRRQLRERNTIHLNPTQAVVVALVNLLPKSTYHVFLDNLFSSCDLFRRLRQRGHGATGTARKNCGIYKPLVKLKAIDNTAAGSLEFNVVKAIPTADNKVNQIAWKDNALVLFLTTVFKGNERLDCIRKKPTTDQMQARPIQRFFWRRPC
ncbi:Uncharacterized protein HZ326_28491 [Fusarium oxysporum f. sp. albedinis]|nr:Uncharacterized protein HZ326_28491 [Fusarium oxysporum f. sp. albedinis]